MDLSKSEGAQGLRDTEIMSQIQQQLQIKYLQEAMQKITEKCFQKCVTKPGTALDSSEQKCLANCMDRYQDASKIVAQAYTARIQQESQNYGAQ